MGTGTASVARDWRGAGEGEPTASHRIQRRPSPLSQERTPYPRGPAREINKSARLFFKSRPKSQRNATEQRVLGRLGGKRDGDSGGAFTVIAHRMHPRHTRAACEAFRIANGTRQREGRESAPKAPIPPKATMRGMEPSLLCYLIQIRNIISMAVALPSRGLRAAWSLATPRDQPVAEPPQEEPAGHRRERHGYQNHGHRPSPPVSIGMLKTLSSRAL